MIAGNNLATASAIADETALTAQDLYQGWSGGAALDIDTNSDSVGNGRAWLLGAAGHSANASGLLPVANQNAGDLVLNFICLKPANRGAAVLKLQYSKDFGL